MEEETRKEGGKEGRNQFTIGKILNLIPINNTS